MKSMVIDDAHTNNKPGVITHVSVVVDTSIIVISINCNVYKMYLDHCVDFIGVMVCSSFCWLNIFKVLEEKKAPNTPNNTN